MSASTQTPVSDELEKAWQKATEGGNLRWIQIEIENDTCIFVHSENGTGSIAGDFNEMGKRCSSKATYFVFRLEGARRWLLVTYVPEGVSVKDKMVYASTKGTLKSKLGYSFFDEEVHFTAKNEVTWENYLDSRKAVESRSSSELMREEVYKQEETERKERGTATTDATSSS